ncbi:MAG: hypothetical protein IH851_11840, partial [Armatimonadetes bacterium]|nr:hypothetical protein [Armatimonadota bacterium]
MIALSLTAIMMAQAQGPADLKADPRLSAVISVRADAQTLDALVKALSQQLNVPLKSAGTIKQDLVVLYAKDRPAHEVLSVIAEHFHWEWRKEEDGYRIVQTPEARKDEQRLLDELILKPYLQIGEEAQKDLKALENVDSAQAREELRKVMEQLSAIWDDENWREEMSMLEQERLLASRWIALKKQLNPTWKLVNTVTSELKPSDWKYIDRHGKIVFSYNPTPAQRPFSHKARKAAEEFVHAALALHEDPEWDPVRYYVSNLRFPEEFRAEDVGTVRLVIRRRGAPHTKADADPRLQYAVTILDRSGKPVGVEDLRSNKPLGWPRKPVEGPKAEPPLDRRLPVTNELRRLNEPFPNTSGAAAYADGWRAFMKPGSKADPNGGLALLMNEVAAAAGVSLIADAYDTSDALYVEPLPLRSAWNAFAIASDRYRYDWSWDGQWVKFRTWDWPLARASTVPRDVLRNVRDRVAAHGGYSLDGLSSLARALSDRQAASTVLNRLIIFWPARNEAQGFLYALRMWDGLSAPQRAVLRRGGGLRWSDLSPPARASLYEALNRLSEEMVNDIGGMLGDGSPILRQRRLAEEWNLPAQG